MHYESNNATILLFNSSHNGLEDQAATSKSIPICFATVKHTRFQPLGGGYTSDGQGIRLGLLQWRKTTQDRARIVDFAETRRLVRFSLPNAKS
ncbi:hypothetical protein DY000_02052754 [Brassica cretica]|uniref:Uncharacterized protein n=1 Tax=Brassica cretica TaxID=69181 RepID=A0ABQ7AHH4_BRACR|nr:hypothetical protein DY000_02052754 [Brassica cretica]